MDSVDIKKDFGGKILNNTAHKFLELYVPPIARIETIDADQRMTITQYEETANIGDLKPQSTILYELNCSERMSRELSMDFQVNGKSGALHKPSDWRYVPPEGNGARLLKMLCQP